MSKMYPPSTATAGRRAQIPTHPELDETRVFLSGVTDGVGERIAGAFAAEHTRLILHSRQTPARAGALADGAARTAAGIRLFAGDVGRDQAACERLARAGLGAYGGIDYLINFVTLPIIGDELGTAAEDIETLAADAMRPALVLSRALADHARNAGRPATVIHVGLERSGGPLGFAIYSMLKSGIEAMAQDQARRWFSHDVCVYGFVPGLPKDDFADQDEFDNVVSARSNFDGALTALLLNCAAGRSKWLNGVTVPIQD